MNREQITGRPTVRMTIEATVKSATEKTILRVKQLNNQLTDYNSDFAKSVRLSELMCRACYYLEDRIASMGFWHVKCEECNSEFPWGSGHIPKICLECSIKNSACRWCYGDIHNER